MHDVSMRSVVARIKEQEHLLAQVAQVWGISIGSSTDEALVKTACERMRNRHAARSVWQRLDEGERRCLYEVLSAASRAQGVPCERVRKKVKGSEGAFEAALTQLRDRWLLVEEDEIPAKAAPRRGTALGPTLVQPPVFVRAIFPYRELSESLYRTGRELFISYEARSVHSLQHLLRMMPWEQFEHLARLCHVTTQTSLSVYSSGASSISHPSEVQRRVAEAMQQPLIVFELVHRLSQIAQGLFLWLVEHDGKACIEEVQAYLTKQHCAGEEQLTLLESLEGHALAFDTLLPGGEREVFIHQDVFAAIKEEGLERISDEQHYAFFPIFSEPTVIREAEPVVLYDLATIIGWTYQQVIEQTREGKIPKRWVGKIRPMQHGLPRRGEGQEDMYPDQLFKAATSLHLLRCDSRDDQEKPRYRSGPKLAEFGMLSVLDQLRLFLQWWMHSDSWYDVQLDGKLIYPGASSSSKKTLLSFLQQCVPERWYRIDALLFSLWKQAPLYLYDPYRRQPERLSLRERRARWLQYEGELYRGYLVSALYEAGILSLGYDHALIGREDDHPDLFRISPLGAQMIAETSTDLEPVALPLLTAAGKKLIVQPSFELLLFQFDPELVYQLVQFAQIKRIGPVSTFTLSQSALLHGLEAGNRVEQILAFLTECSQQELPQNIVYSLNEWARGYREAHLEEVILIELSAEQMEGDVYRVLEELCIGLRKLASGTFVVTATKNSFFELRKRLEKEGIVVRHVPPHE